MSLHMITRMFAGVLIVECSGRLVLGEESANLRHLVRDHLIEPWLLSGCECQKKLRCHKLIFVG
jgi:hypothetical protein